MQSSSGSDQPWHGQLAVQNGLYVLYANDVICGAAQQIGAEHDGFKVKLLAGFHRHGGVQLSAVEKHNVSGVGLKQIGAALHGQRALHHTEKLHFAVPVTIKRVKAVFASNAVVHHGHQCVAVAAGFPHAVKLIFVRKTHLLLDSVVRIVIKADKLAVDFPKHIAYTYDRAGARKAQVPITEFLNFFERQ